MAVNGMTRRLCLLLALSVGLVGCGVAYQPAGVRDSGDTDLRVVALTPQSVLQANRSAFTPQSLPQAYAHIAGGGGRPLGVGVLPDPVLEPQDRPTVFEQRLPPQQQPQAYRLGVGDVVVLSTSQAGGSVEALTGLLAAQSRRQGYTVQDDGAIAIPDVGRITLGGLTLEEAEAIVFRNLVEARVDPSFSIEVAEFNSQRVSVGGDVNRPGFVPIALQPLYLEEALAAVGGVGAEDTSVAVIRMYRDGVLYQISVDDLFSQSNLRRVLLLDGDTIFVDTAYDLDRAQAYFEQQITLLELRQRARNQALQELQLEMNIRRAALAESRSNFETRLDLGGVERDYVYVIGEVQTQTRFALPFDARAVLADALLESGGVRSQTGNPGQIYVLRSNADGAAITAFHLDARNAVNFVMATQLELRPADVVFVAAQPVTNWNRVVTQILPSASLARAVNN